MDISRVGVNKVESQVDDKKQSSLGEKTATSQFNPEAQTISASASPKALAAQVRIFPNTSKTDPIHVPGLGTVQMTPEKWQAFQKKLELAVLLAS